jgi:hypothetical protein
MSILGVLISKSFVCCSYVMCPLAHFMPPCALYPSHHTTIKRVGKWPSTNLAKTSLNDSLFHHKNNGKDNTWNKCHMKEISIFRILCEINPQNRKISLWTPRITISKSGFSPVVVWSLPRSIRWCENRRNPSLYVEIVVHKKS